MWQQQQQLGGAVILSASSLEKAGCKRPFCNACRMLVMDRMCSFLPFHPHPALDERHATLFATKVTEQYQMKDQKVRKRKADGVWCTHCRSETGVFRQKKDRFTLMWDDPIVRQRVNTDWFKDVRFIDEELTAKAKQLLEVGEGGNGVVIKGITDSNLFRLSLSESDSLFWIVHPSLLC